MQTPSFTKYGFRIRTRVGVVVDNLMIHGKDVSDAQQKLRQMYRDCEILECACVSTSGQVRGASANYEDVLGLITH